jgi:hypothetical protein
MTYLFQTPIKGISCVKLISCVTLAHVLVATLALAKYNNLDHSKLFCLKDFTYFWHSHIPHPLFRPFPVQVLKPLRIIKLLKAVKLIRALKEELSMLLGLTLVKMMVLFGYLSRVSHRLYLHPSIRPSVPSV